MQIQVNTDHNIVSREALGSRVRSTVESALTRSIDHITRVEVHLSDETNKKGGVGVMRCVMEARLERHPPVAVTHQAETMDHAVHGAANKLTRLIDHTIARMREHKALATSPGLAALEESES